MTFIFGDQDETFFSYTLLRWEYPDQTDEWDANWIVARIQTRANIGVIRIQGTILPIEILELYSKLNLLVSNKEAEAAFEPTEPYVQLSILKENEGFRVNATVNESPLSGESFPLSFTVSRHEINATIAQLKTCLEKFPARYLSDATLAHITSAAWYREESLWWSR